MIEIFYNKSYLNIKKKKNRNLKKFKKKHCTSRIRG